MKMKYQFTNSTDSLIKCGEFWQSETLWFHMLGIMINENRQVCAAGKIFWTQEDVQVAIKNGTLV